MRRKKKIDKNLKKIYGIIVFIIAVFIAWKTPALEVIDQTIANTGLANIVDTSDTSNITSLGKVKDNIKIQENVSESIVLDKEKLNILFFYVGQADSQLIFYKNQTMLIDAGNQSDGELIVNAIKALGIEKLDYVVGTHIHEDHIGGLSDVINSLEVGKLYLPYNTTTTSKYYKKLLTSIQTKELEINEAVVGDKITLEDITCEIMAVDNNEPENQNLASIVLEFSYGDLKYLFMGDAESENEKLRNWNDIDVLKVGHHGSNTSSSEDFLNQVLPEISIISVGKDNSYGLPKDKILERLEKINSKIYRTDTDGTIQIISDGKENIINKIDLNLDGN